MDDPALTALTGVPAHRLATVTRLFVTPWVRGRGAEARLMDQVSSRAVEQGLQLVLEVVDDGGPAVALYDRLGWRGVDHRLADWTTPDGRRLPIRVYVAPDRPSSAP
jgi:ribosomal protein S18 acetylase RimI-like enzyme